jgi:hypothetical protein
MGSLHAREMANSNLTLDAQLEWHLRANHYPPIPLSMVEPCKQAIDAYWEGDLDKEIEMPEGVYYRGETTAPARAIIIQHHLDAWCEEYDYEEEV